MPHTAPYRPAGGPDEPSSPGLLRGDVLRSFLWTVAVGSAVVNMVLSFGKTATSVHLICGAVTLICGGILAAGHLKGRR